MAGRKAAVLGSPVSHSRSPQLHLAAYRALGLDDWTYERIECTAEQLPPLVGSLGPEWVGLSVTMPGKFAALVPVQLFEKRNQRCRVIDGNRHARFQAARHKFLRIQLRRFRYSRNLRFSFGLRLGLGFGL